MALAFPWDVSYTKVLHVFDHAVTSKFVMINAGMSIYKIC